MKKRITANIRAMADELGNVRQRILKLEAREAELKAEIRNTGFQSIDGGAYYLELQISERAVPSWKVIAIKAGASKRLIDANTNVQEITTIKTTRYS